MAGHADHTYVANLVGVVRLEVGVTSLSCNGLGLVVLRIDINIDVV